MPCAITGSGRVAEFIVEGVGNGRDGEQPSSCVGVSRPDMFGVEESTTGARNPSDEGAVKN